jgi:hypothetical protein
MTPDSSPSRAQPTPAEVTAAEWHQLLETLREETGQYPLARSASKIGEAAFAQPVLRGLFPWRDRWELHFSTRIEQPYSSDTPFVNPLRDGGYEVRGPDQDLIGETATAEEAVALVMAQLPAGSGPAAGDL